MLFVVVDLEFHSELAASFPTDKRCWMVHTEDRETWPSADGKKSGVSRGRQNTAQVRLRTLVLIRWIAIFGQLAAILIVEFGFGWVLPLNAALAAIAASAVLNLTMAFRHPMRGRLSEWEAAAYLAFDVLQLAALLYLTGGLGNPFALLFLGPVTVSATVLSRAATAMLSVLAISCASVLAFNHLPLPWAEGGLYLPVFYVVGLWVAVAVGTLFLAGYISSVAAEGRRMSDALTAIQLALAREQQLSAVGGLAAAAAHELGSPLATIAVTAKELEREIPDVSEFSEDVRILRLEVDRCRDILAELGRSPKLADSAEPFATALLSDVAAAAAARHRADGITLEMVATGLDESPEPLAARSPELLHGLGNVIQNSVQFATACVSVDISWDEREARVEVRDDGPGFSPAVLDRIGEP
ncbi:MAG TPA: sensor histidine kinase, partial [Rhodospirillaceae bacterium]|nr:sensor histidine kinase [Rhodospirillaceae bacterium]